MFVPYPHAADNHQKKNVTGLETLGAAIVADDGELTGDYLRTIIEALLDDEAGKIRMKNTFTAWASPDADDFAAERIIELVARTRSESVSSNVSDPVRAPEVG